MTTRTHTIEYLLEQKSPVRRLAGVVFCRFSACFACFSKTDPFGLKKTNFYVSPVRGTAFLPAPALPRSMAFPVYAILLRGTIFLPAPNRVERHPRLRCPAAGYNIPARALPRGATSVCTLFAAEKILPEPRPSRAKTFTKNQPASSAPHESLTEKSQL